MEIIGNWLLASLGAGFSPPDAIPSNTNFWVYVTNVANFFISLIGVLATLFVIWSGFNYVRNKDIDESKQAIANVILGLVIVIIAYALVSFVTGEESFLYSQSAEFTASE
ncbi:MAG: hypothetical protein U9Q15_03200 [Patescibacteria group bacterium]|nr:hypothetical protein [Patescibacteria group bacterium]